MMTISGTNLRKALKMALDLGAQVKDRKGTGEKVLTHPLWGRPITVNARRKDCPRILTTALAHLLRDTARLEGGPNV